MSAQAIEISDHRSVPALTPITPMAMLAQAIERGMPVETIDKLMALGERWDATQSRKAFDVAIARAKAEIPVIQKTAKGHNNKYADLAAIARVVDPIIAKHGLSYRFRTTQTDKISVTCVLSHEAGHFEENTLVGKPDTGPGRNEIQAIGSALTYLQRYSLVQALGLAASADDDDGKAAGVGSNVNDDQVVVLRSLIVETAADIAKFCKFMKVERLEDISQRDFDKARLALEAKRAKS